MKISFQSIFNPSMNSSYNKILLDEFAKYDINITSIREVKRGRNSKVFRLESLQKIYICKQYPNRVDSGRSRLESEFSVLKFLNKEGIENIPKPLFCNKAYNLAAYSFLEGTVIKKVNTDVINGAIKFYQKLNKFSYIDYQSNIPNAAEACFSMSEHFDLVKSRINRFLVNSTSSGLQKKAFKLVENKLLENFYLIREQAYLELGDNLFQQKLPDHCKHISQSDVGIHNMFLSNQSFLFYDFEYAGWDDPGKFIVDLILQPDNLLDFELSKQVIFNVENYAYDASRRKKLRLMLNLYRIKWAIIILNPYLRQEISEIELSNCLKKSDKYFSMSAHLVAELSELLAT